MKIGNNSSPISFNSLTKVLKKDVMALPHKDAVRLIDSYDKKNLFVGYFPDDILPLIQKSSISKDEVTRKVKAFNAAFSYQAKIINRNNSKVITKVKEINLEDLAYKAIVNNAIMFNKKGYRSGYVNPRFKFYLSSSEMEKLLNNEKINSVMKNIGVIPKDGKINFSYVGEGTYKNCFKVDFLDKDGNKLIHSKAFVICKDPNIGEKSNQIVKHNMSEYIKNTDYEKFDTVMSTRLYHDDCIPENIKEVAKNEIPKFYSEYYKNLNIYRFGTVMEDFFDINGIFPEANAAIKIRHDLGKNIKYSNMITPYIYDLKNNCGLAEFADNDVAPTTVIYDLKKHHLCWIDNKEENYSNNDENKRKVVDYGCFFPDRKYYYR